MADDKIRSDELIEKDIFNNTADSAIKAFEAVEKFTAALIGTSQAASTLLNIMPKTLKEFKEQNVAIREIEKTVTALAKAEKIRGDILRSVNITEEKLAARREQLAAQRLTSEQKVSDAINKSASAEKIANEKIRQEVEKTNAVKQKTIQSEIAAKQKLESEALKQLITEQKVEQQKIATSIASVKLETATRKEAAAAQLAADKAKRQNDAYGKLSREHKDLVRDAQNLGAALGTDSKQFMAAMAAANKLDAQLKKLDGSLGMHQRNVGNYASAWKGVAQGFQNFLGAAGISVGIGAVIGGLKDSVAAFAEAEKNARALEFALKNVAGEGTIAFETLIAQSEELQANGGVFSDDDIQKAQAQLVNYGLLSDEVETLMPKILDLAAATGQDLGSATDTVIKGMNGQVKGLKMVGLEFEDTGSKAENYSIILDKLTKFEGAAADQATTTEGKYLVLMNRFDDLKEDIGEFLINEGAKYLEYWDVVTGKVSGFSFVLNEINKKQSDALSPFVDNAIAASKAATNVNDKFKVLTQTTIDLVQAQYLYTVQRDEFAKKGDAAAVESLNGTIAVYQAQIDRLQEYKDDLNATGKEKKKFDERTGDGNTGGSSRVEKVKEDNTDIAWEMQRLGDELYQIEVEKNKKIEHEERVKAANHKKWLDEKHRREMEEHDRRKKLYDQQMKEDEERRKKELEDAISFDEKLSDATFASIDRRIDAEEKALNDKGDDIDSELQRQSDRQLAGLDNTYAEQVKLKAENDAKLAELDEKRRKAEEAKELAELFIEFTKAYAKNGDINAAQKALAQAVAVKAIADTIAGSFYEGTEDTGTTAKPLDNKGGRVAILHDNERVIPKRLNKLLSGVSNDELIDKALMFDSIYKPQLAAVMSAEDSKSFTRKDSDWMGSAVLNQLVSLEKTVKDKPEYTEKYDEKEKTTVGILKSMGITKKIIYKRF